MISIMVLYIAAFSVFLFMGLNVLFINHRQRINILFFALSLCLSVSTIGGVLIQFIDDPATAQWWFKSNTAVSIVIPTLFLVFAVEISRLPERKVPVYLTISAITLFIVVKLLIPPAIVELITIGGLWYMRDILIMDTFFLYIIYFVLSMIVYFVVLLHWRKRTRNIKEKRQAYILLFSYFTGVMAVLAVLLLHYFEIIRYLVTGYGVFFFLPWFVAIFYCIVRFHFLTLTPEVVSRELIESIDESIILLDSQKKIVFSNDKFGVSMKNVTNTYSGLDEIIVESEQLTREIDRLLEREATSFVCRCTYWVGGDRSVTVSAKFSLVQDTYGDVLGIMIVAKRIKEIKQLQSFYRITRREGQILQQLIAGLTYNEMTTLLHITRNTLKRHIANIYIKLGVNNRVELFNLLREYNLIPADKADRTILLSSNSTS